MLANEHKSLARKNKRCKDDRTTDADKSYPSFLYPSHLDYDELAPHRGIFKNTLCESVRALLTVCSCRPLIASPGCPTFVQGSIVCRPQQQSTQPRANMSHGQVQYNEAYA